MHAGHRPAGMAAPHVRASCSSSTRYVHVGLTDLGLMWRSSWVSLCESQSRGEQSGTCCCHGKACSSEAMRRIQPLADGGGSPLSPERCNPVGWKHPCGESPVGQCLSSGAMLVPGDGNMICPPAPSALPAQPTADRWGLHV